MKLTVIGSADAFSSAGRGNSCYLVESEGSGKLMIDFGPTALLGLRRQEVRPEELGGVVFTHLHGDHIGGFPLLVIDAMYNGWSKRELTVLGPVLAIQKLSDLLRATYGDLERDVPARLDLSIAELEPGQERRIAGYRIAGFAAEHMELPHRPLCLRVSDAAGRCVAFSGDTVICPGLLAAADGADLLVADCTRWAPPAGAHATWEEWQRVLPEVRARAILFSHLGADVRAALPDALRQRDYGVPLRVADDGMVVEI